MFERISSARATRRAATAVLGLTVALLPLTTVASMPSRPAALPLSQAPLGAIRAAQTETLLLSLMNGERGSAGMRRLRMHRKLIKVARRHSARMASSGAIFHNSRLARRLRRLSWSIAGENVGVGNSIETLHQAFMDSPPHRENVMRGQFRRVGVGVLLRDARLWVTVVFLG